MPRGDRSVDARPTAYPAMLIATASANSALPLSGRREGRVVIDADASAEEIAEGDSPRGKGLLIVSGLLAVLTVARRRI